MACEIVDGRGDYHGPYCDSCGGDLAELNGLTAEGIEVNEPMACAKCGASLGDYIVTVDTLDWESLQRPRPAEDRLYATRTDTYTAAIEVAAGYVADHPDCRVRIVDCGDMGQVLDVWEPSETPYSDEGGYDGDDDIDEAA